MQSRWERLLVKKLIAVALLLGSATVAAQIPTIIGHVRGKQDSEITFTTEQGSCSDDTRLAYIQRSGGEIALLGCWRKIGAKIFVTWSDGGVYSYDVEFIQFTKEWMDYSNK
jgi:hypothetical protein